MWLISVKIITGMSASCNNKYPEVRVHGEVTLVIEGEGISSRDGEVSSQLVRRDTSGRARRESSQRRRRGEAVRQVPLEEKAK